MRESAASISLLLPSMHPSLNTLLLLVILAMPAAAPAAEATKPAPPVTAYFVEEPAKWASPEKVLPPQYPKAALEKGLAATVDLVLNVKDTGLPDSVVAIQSEPKDETFEAAVMEVLRHWRFAQSYDATCGPIAAQSRLRVWFEVKAGQPSISVSHVPPANPPGTAAIEVTNRDEVRALLREGLVRILRSGSQPGAAVYARLTVEPQSGLTQSVDIVTMQGSPKLFEKPAGQALATAREPSLVVQYGIATRNALKKARFQPGSVAGDAPITVCYAVSYNRSEEEKS